jgi:hypothetical protein
MCPMTVLHLQSGMFPSRALGWHVPHDSITPTVWHVPSRTLGWHVPSDSITPTEWHVP